MEPLKFKIRNLQHIRYVEVLVAQRPLGEMLHFGRKTSVTLEVGVLCVWFFTTQEIRFYDLCMGNAISKCLKFFIISPL